MPRNDHVVLDKLLDNVVGWSPWNFNPQLWEEGTCAHDEHKIHNCVNRICYNIPETSEWRDVVGQPRDWYRLKAIWEFLPDTDDPDYSISAILLGKKLCDEVNIADKSSLEYDRRIRHIEKFYRVCSLNSSHLLTP